MILAAGYGKRLAHSRITPRNLISIGEADDRPPSWETCRSRNQGSGYKFGTPRFKNSDFLGSGSTWGISIEYSDEGPPSRNGGGAGLLCWERYFSFSNGDVWTALISLSFLKHSVAMTKLCFSWRSNRSGERRGFQSWLKVGSGNQTPNLLYAGIASIPVYFSRCSGRKVLNCARLKNAIKQDRVVGQLINGEWMMALERLAALRKYGE